MTWPFALFTYVNVWAISLFAVLPFRLGVKRAVAWNTLVAGVVTLLIYLLLKSGLVPLRHVY